MSRRRHIPIAARRSPPRRRRSVHCLVSIRAHRLARRCSLPRMRSQSSYAVGSARSPSAPARSSAYRPRPSNPGLPRHCPTTPGSRSREISNVIPICPRVWSLYAMSWRSSVSGLAITSSTPRESPPSGRGSVTDALRQGGFTRIYYPLSHTSNGLTIPAGEVSRKRLRRQVPENMDSGSVLALLSGTRGQFWHCCGDSGSGDLGSVLAMLHATMPELTPRLLFVACNNARTDPSASL